MIPSPSQPGSRCLAALRPEDERRLRSRLEGSRVTFSSVPFRVISQGSDNLVLTGRSADGVEVVIKCRRTARPARYAVADWAGQQLRRLGVPTPTVLWHDPDVCVETLVAGRSLDTGSDDRQAPLGAAHAAGNLLRRIHTVPVAGFGALDGAGSGRHPTLAGWLTSHRATDELRKVPDAGSLVDRVEAVLRELAPSLPASLPRLLHGDWVARHVLTVARSSAIPHALDPGHSQQAGARVTGIVDLESVRGGDPVADLAGWSLQEPHGFTYEMFRGYGVDADPMTTLRLVLHRLRIGVALAGHHYRQADPARVRRCLKQVQCDLDDLELGRLRVIPHG